MLEFINSSDEQKEEEKIFELIEPRFLEWLDGDIIVGWYIYVGEDYYLSKSLADKRYIYINTKTGNKFFTKKIIGSEYSIDNRYNHRIK